jgi:hypothetical protein
MDSVLMATRSLSGLPVVLRAGLFRPQRSQPLTSSWQRRAAELDERVASA